MAALVLTAFTFEANMNFLGETIIADWKDHRLVRFASLDKLDLILKKLKLPLDYGKRPFSSIPKLMEFRDIVAHGKPNVRKFDEIKDMDPEEVDRQTGLAGEWEQYCKPDLVANVHDDVDEIWKMVLIAAEIPVYKTMTSGTSSVSLVGDVS